ncbi:COP9 (constitutive photomorphogenic) homolog, subunit [Seminavis robusta]|uniref:COP9 (Constitutive photomorphogenic) homolog, subunit n=1 Tax=Seminavis robusta TaxID=568900 RepID=A0A9N8H419_9STRA|nr:COP9 (constitutive photomorphogenic) homolog, subunit [Seminavis robusta]|eukprot:Sro102_g052080.1 COP9 (constitutive photomorphogenic) homolog, subunit (301) ;mRNA; f:61352-62254
MDADEAFKPILQLARDSANANLPTIRTVVMKALSDPRVFTGFDEIKQVLQPKLATCGAEGEILLRTLDLFSHGTFGDYTTSMAAIKGSSSVLLTLTDSQIFKLRQLTLLTLVHQACRDGKPGCAIRIPYATVAQELGLGSLSEDDSSAVLRQVEGIVLECVYARLLLAGQLCQKSQSLLVSSRHGPPCRPRDVPLSRAGALLEILTKFHGTLDNAKNQQNHIQTSLQMNFDSTRLYHKAVHDNARKAEHSSSGSMATASSASLIMGGVRGWSERQGDERRSSVKRSRGGLGGSMEPFNRY